MYDKYLPSIISCFILSISFLISSRISCFHVSNSALVTPPPVALVSPFLCETSISSASDPNRVLRGLGDSDPLLDCDFSLLLLSPYALGDVPFSNPGVWREPFDCSFTTEFFSSCITKAWNYPKSLCNTNFVTKIRIFC